METPIRLSDGEDVEEAEDDEKADGQILPPTLCWLHGTFGLLMELMPKLAEASCTNM